MISKKMDPYQAIDLVVSVKSDIQPNWNHIDAILEITGDVKRVLHP